MFLRFELILKANTIGTRILLVYIELSRTYSCHIIYLMSPALGEKYCVETPVVHDPSFGFESTSKILLQSADKFLKLPNANKIPASFARKMCDSVRKNRCFHGEN